VLSFQSEAREASGCETPQVHRSARRRGRIGRKRRAIHILARDGLSRGRAGSMAGGDYILSIRRAGPPSARPPGPAPRAPALEAAHLARAVTGKVLTSDISVRVQVGEVMAVVGPSGAGKSSFLRLLNRLDEPTDGTVRVNGQDYRELAPQELRRR